MVDIRKAIENSKKQELKRNVLCVPSVTYSEEVMEELKGIMCRFSSLAEQKIEQGKDFRYGVSALVANDSNLDNIIKRSTLASKVTDQDGKIPVVNSKNAAITVDKDSKLMYMELGVVSSIPFIYELGSMKVAWIKVAVGIVNKDYVVQENACFIQVYAEYLYEKKPMCMCLTVIGMENVETIINGEANIIKEAVCSAICAGAKTYYDFNSQHRLLSVAENIRQ